MCLYTVCTVVLERACACVCVVKCGQFFSKLPGFDDTGRPLKPCMLSRGTRGVLAGDMPSKNPLDAYVANGWHQILLDAWSEATETQDTNTICFADVRVYWCWHSINPTRINLSFFSKNQWTLRPWTRTFGHNCCRTIQPYWARAMFALVLSCTRMFPFFEPCDSSHWIQGHSGPLSRSERFAVKMS